ncbi:RING finger protein 17 isoform X2 [Monomorium pharaonis]|uniref:RING finger protein 17 isoform X2 n=1 Tax=Monomorium pharaonis TaxID=307658 RepID=UPI00063F7E42|nr:RING finger protein 17 isoform X2 [Monomorium pharaonis]
MGKRGGTAANRQFQTRSVRVRTRRRPSGSTLDPTIQQNRRRVHDDMLRPSSSGSKMYPCIADVSRRKTSRDRLSSPRDYRVPSTKLRNVICVVCRCKFYVSDVSNLNNLNGSISKGTLVPLLLDCGHPICNKCNRKIKIRSCIPCNKIFLDNNVQGLLPLNLYALGLIISSYHRPLQIDDDEFSFCHKLSVQLREVANTGCCHECGNRANVKCPQCMVLYCHCCYLKIHGRALQSHTKIPISEEDSNNPAALLNSCSSTCTEMLSRFCNDCNVAGCSNCFFNSHKLHDHVSLSVKNQTMIDEFNETYMNIEDTLLRVCETKEKVNSAIISNTYNLQNSEAIEASIAQHFAYLHGVLQNTEAKLMNQLQQQDDILKNNLEEIQTQLSSQEAKLKLTLQIASYVKETFHKVDVQNAINILTEMADLPCHLMYKDMGQNHNAKLIIDNSIVAAIEDHCTIELPPVSSYSLLRKDELPKNYMVSPLPKKPRTKIIDLQSSVIQPSSSEPSLNKPSLSEPSPSTSIKTENKKEESISEFKVKVTYTVNPSLFFVQKVATKADFMQLEKDLIIYANNYKQEAPININQDDMCIVKQWKTVPDGTEWYRGSVKLVTKTKDGGKIYNVLYIDYGYEEYNVVAPRVLEIPDHLQTLPPQAIRCSLHGVVPKNMFWTKSSINDFMRLISGIECTMSVIKSTPDMLYVDLCLIHTNMGPQSMCTTMKMMNHARLDINQNSAQKSETTYVYNKEGLILNKTVIVNVGWIDSPDQIYVSKATLKSQFLKLRNELNEYYKKETSAKMIETPQKGLPCAVQLDNDIWYRGEITEIVNENQVKVFCVDWGRTLLQDRDALRVIPHRYTIFKAQAIKISLMYVAAQPDGTWKPEACETLMTLFNEAKCILVNPRKQIENGYIGCMYNDNVDISRQLKSAGVVNDFNMSKLKKKSRTLKYPSIACPSELEKTDDTVKDFSILLDDTESIISKDETPKDPFKVEVRVQRVVTPDCIYVAQAEYEKSNAKMVSAMQKFYDNFLSAPRDNWKEGALCAVYSVKDKSYFRAKILKITSPTEVLVYFYDMGIEETVTMKDIQILHSKFAKEMTYCFKVKLAGILPCGGSSSWPSLSCLTLSEIIRDNAYCKFYITKPVQEEMSDDVVPVELWVRQAKIPGPLAPTKIEINSVNRMLVEKGVALPIKNYFAQADSTLAKEFKQQLESGNWIATFDEEVKWFNKADETEMNDSTISHKTDPSYHNNIDILNTSTWNIKSNDTMTNRECAEKFSDWLPPNEITEEVFHSIPTYVDNKCVVYLHSKKYNADMLHYIETELQNHYKNIKINKEKQWKEGEICIAQYHYNQKWYRGRIAKNLGNILQVEFVDYGNVEDCEREHVTDYVRLGHIPIQCTKCVISGLRPASPSGKWMLHDLDRIHALLVDQECKVSILQRQPAYLSVSITLLRPWKCDLLLYLTNHMDMNIKIERKDWNDSDNSDEDLNSTRDVVIEDTISDYDKLCTADTVKKSLSETNTLNNTLNENLINDNLIELSQMELLDIVPRNKQVSDTESLSSIEMTNMHLISSTPQPQSEEEEQFASYKHLIIPQETKYIELILCCNKDAITSYAQLAQNNDDIFSNELHEYYLQYEAIMSEIQSDICQQPLITSFAMNTPCIAKFADNTWYRCIITNSERIPNTQYINISLYYVDFGNHEYKKLDVLSKDHNLRIPKEEWLELPAMAIKCTFWGLNYVSNDISLLASKLNEIYNQAVVARIIDINDGNNLVVEIYKDKTCQELFYAHLIEEGFYQLKDSKKTDDQ